MALAHVFRAIRLSPLVLMLAGALPLAASAADSTWTSTTDGNWNNSANWSASDSPCFDAGGPNFGYDGGAFFTVPGTQKNTSLSGPCLINHLVFGVSDGWVVDGYNGVLFSSASLAGYGPASILQADADVVINAIVQYNGGLIISGAGDVTLNETGNGFSGIGTVTINGPGTTAIANLVDDANNNPVVVNGGVLNASPTGGSHDLLINAPGSVTTSGATWRTISGSGNLTLAGGTTSVAPSTFTGNISGAGALQKIGSGTLVLTGTNTWSGGTTIAQGTLQVGDGVSGTYPGFALANYGLLVLNATGLSTLQSYVGTGDIVINGGIVALGTGLSLGNGSLTINGGALTGPAVSSNNVVTVNAPGQLVTGNSSAGSLAGNGTITLAAGSPLQVGLDNSDRSFSGLITGGGTINKIGAGKQTFGNIAATGAIAIISGTIELNASTVASPITINGGTLLGTGTVNAPVVVAPGGTIRSALPGAITTGNLTALGTVHIQIDGTTPSVSHSQIFVNGTVTLNSATLQLSGSYTPVIGDVFAVIVNDASDAVSGTFSGLPEGATIALNGVGMRVSYAGGSGNDVVLSVGTQVVTPGSSGNGTIAPATPQTIANGTMQSFTLTPASHYHSTAVTGTCGGSLVGNTFTTSAVTTDCTVIANFAIDSFTVTASAGANGSISPSQPVNYGSKATFILTPNSNYHNGSVGGTCPAGVLTGNSYETGVIVGACTVIASFAIDTHTVTPSAGVNGSINPITPQAIDHNAQATFTVTPNPGYAATVGGTCGGLLVGNTFTTGAITQDCAVSATFVALVTYNVVLEGWQQVGPYVATPASGSGTAIFNPVAHTLKLNLTYSGLGSAETGAHLHGPGIRGANAAILLPLAASNPKTDELTLFPNEETMLANGQLYVNIHTTNYPNGEIRGQIDNVGATVTRVLTVTKTGSGTVSGTTEAGTVISCGSDCTETVPNGKVVTLTATPDAGFALQAWGGACTGSGPFTCTVTMDAAKTVSATFVSLGSDLGTTLTATPNPAIAGQDVTFTLTVSSAGPEAGDGVNTWAFIPSGAIFISASAGCTQSTLGPNPIVLCTPNTLAIGATAQYTFVLRRATAGTLTVNADISSSKQDPVAANNQSTVSVTVGPQTRLGNISTRMQVLTGNDVLIGGFVIGGSGSKRVAVVATGPSLTQYGITNALAHPTLTLVRQSDQTVIATNDGWQNAANAAQLTAAGFSPSNVLESAILVDLAPGAYTAIVSGAGNVTGVGVVAVYEVDHPELPLVNISTRGQVLTGNDVMIGGFIINGSTSQTVAIVATGPSLVAYGITNALANPTLTLVRQSDQTVVATNDDWQSAGNAAQLQAAGFAPVNALESAILVTLPPGAYTAIVSGAGGGTGVGIVGVYVVN